MECSMTYVVPAMAENMMTRMQSDVLAMMKKGDLKGGQRRTLNDRLSQLKQLERALQDPLVMEALHASVRAALLQVRSGLKLAKLSRLLRAQTGLPSVLKHVPLLKVALVDFSDCLVTDKDVVWLLEEYERQHANSGGFCVRDEDWVVL